MRNLLILVLLLDGDLLVHLISFFCLPFLWTHTHSLRSHISVPFEATPSPSCHLEWGFDYGEIEFCRQQSMLEHGQYNLVFCLIDLQQLLIEAGYILPQSFSFLLMNVEKMSHWLLMLLSSDEMMNKTLTELFKVCNNSWGVFC